MSQQQHERQEPARCQGRWAGGEGTGDPPPQNEAWRRKRRALLLPKLSEEIVKKVMCETSFPSNFGLPWIFTSQKPEVQAQDSAKIQPGLGLLSFGRKHLSPFQLSLIPKYFAPQSPWGTRINIPTKCSQSYSTEFKCAVSSTSAAEKCYSRNTFRNRCKEPL